MIKPVSRAPIVPFTVLLLMMCLSGIGQARFLEEKYARKRPKARLAAPPTATVGTRFSNPFKLGKHGYGFSLSERNGMVYTARGGHIDMAHFRKIADWTAYFASKVYNTLQAADTQLTYRLWEPTRYHLTLSYPHPWHGLEPAKKEALAREMAICLAQHMAYTAATWHEMLTWFGYKGIVVWPEFQSAFTWEDNYSNLLGANIAGFALRHPDLSYSDAVTMYLDEALQHLGAQPKGVGRKASAAMRGVWFKGNLMFLSVYRRHFDIGYSDGQVSPWLVTCLPEVPPAMPFPLPVPDVDMLAENGVRFKLEIEPRELSIKGKLLEAAYQGSPSIGKRINPSLHFGKIMKAVRAKGVAKYGKDVELAYSGKNERPETFAVSSP